MSNAKKKIQQLNDPAVHNRRFLNTIGKILKINEKNNTCKVQYVDNNGYYKISDNVYVKLIAPSIIGWFPKVDDIVEIQINESNVLITGPYSYDYSKQQSLIKKDKDILFDNIAGTIGGVIF